MFVGKGGTRRAPGRPCDDTCPAAAPAGRAGDRPRVCWLLFDRPLFCSAGWNLGWSLRVLTVVLTLLWVLWVLLGCCCPQVSDSFPFKWINKKWKEGFYVTSMATSHTRWAVVMSRNAGFVDQVRLLRVCVCRQHTAWLHLAVLLSAAVLAAVTVGSSKPLTDLLLLTAAASLHSVWSWTSSTPLRASTAAGTPASASRPAPPPRTRAPLC